MAATSGFFRTALWDVGLTAVSAEWAESALAALADLADLAVLVEMADLAALADVDVLASKTSVAAVATLDGATGGRTHLSEPAWMTETRGPITCPSAAAFLRDACCEAPLGAVAAAAKIGAVKCAARLCA